MKRVFKIQSIIACFILLLLTIIICFFVCNKNRNQTALNDFSYRDLFTRDTELQWNNIQFGNISLSIPYSSEWRISGVGISVFDISNEDGRILRFGRPSDNGTYITREYFMTKKEKSSFPLDTQLINDESTCGKAEEKTIGDKQGIQLYTGGAKGCSIGFAFELGDDTYTLYHATDIGEPMVSITSEMEKIIQRITETEWRKYTNEDYGFELNYPASFTYSMDWPGRTSDGHWDRVPKRDPQAFSFTFSENEHMSIYVAPNGLIDCPPNDGTWMEVIGSEGTTTISGIKAVMREGVTSGQYAPEGKPIKQITFCRNKTYFKFDISSQDKNNELLDMMLSSFRFF